MDDDAVLLLGFVNGRPTSTVRVNCGDHRRNPYRALYGLDEPGLRLSGGIAIYSKLAILPEFRHGSALLCLSRSAFRAALEEGARVSLLGCRKELLRMYERFGFRRYRSPQQVAGHGLIYPLRLDHEEQAFSAHPRSPLLPVLRDFVRSPAAARWSS